MNLIYSYEKNTHIINSFTAVLLSFTGVTGAEAGAILTSGDNLFI